MKRFFTRLAMTAALCASILAASAAAVDYSFLTEPRNNYYKSSSYEDVYGSAYNYGGKNVIDYQLPELEYGVVSTTMTGVMERAILPSLQQAVVTVEGSGTYGTGGGGPITVLTVEGESSAVSKPSATPSTSTATSAQPSYKEPGYTSVKGMELKDGSIGVVQIPKLNISMKLWEGESTASMDRGLGHFSSTSAWDGNVGVCGHNRGAKYVIGSIKDLKGGDVITYTTTYGTRSYKVMTVKKIASTDWSYLQATSDNRITLTTCVANDPSHRWVVQAVEKK